MVANRSPGLGRCIVKCTGGRRSENDGMSNEKPCKNQGRRKWKDFCALVDIAD